MADGISKLGGSLPLLFPQAARPVQASPKESAVTAIQGYLADRFSDNGIDHILAVTGGGGDCCGAPPLPGQEPVPPGPTIRIPVGTQGPVLG